MYARRRPSGVSPGPAGPSIQASWQLRVSILVIFQLVFIALKYAGCWTGGCKLAQ